MVTVWWSAARLIHYNFRNPSKTVTSDTYAQELIRCTENSNICSQHWSPEWAWFFSQQPPTACHKASASQGELIGLWSLASSTIFTWPLAKQLHLRHLDNFFQRKCVHNQQEQKMLSKSLWNPEARIFTRLHKWNYWSYGNSISIFSGPSILFSMLLLFSR